jgi:hypothetical protein
MRKSSLNWRYRMRFSIYPRYSGVERRICSGVSMKSVITGILYSIVDDDLDGDYHHVG